MCNREPSTESDYLKQAISTSFSQKNTAHKQTHNGNNPANNKNCLSEKGAPNSNSLPRKEKSILQAPSSPGQIRLAKESAEVKSLTLSRLHEQVNNSLDV